LQIPLWSPERRKGRPLSPGEMRKRRRFANSYARAQKKGCGGRVGPKIDLDEEKGDGCNSAMEERGLSGLKEAVAKTANGIREKKKKSLIRWKCKSPHAQSEKRAALNGLERACRGKKGFLEVFLLR